MEKVLRKLLPGGDFSGVLEKRSRTMSAVRGKGNKTTERRLRAALAAAGIVGWKMHSKDIPGCPDFWFPEAGLAVFVDGCFWHGCPACGHVPKTRSRFWQAKIDRNRERDTRMTADLQELGYTVLRFWEHELAAAHRGCVVAIQRHLSIARGGDA